MAVVAAVTAAARRRSPAFSAVFENYVKPNAGRNYSTATINGLTIYTYNNDAAWVNGGILYSCDTST